MPREGERQGEVSALLLPPVTNRLIQATMAATATMTTSKQNIAGH